MGKLSSLKIACSVFVFLIAAAIASPAQTCTTLYNFGNNPDRPNDPIFQGIIAQGRDGNMYSTAPDTWTGNDGTVFEITPAGALTVLHLFDGTDGQNPNGGLTLGTDGMFYGAAGTGGLHSYGEIYKITAAGELTIIYSFTGGDDGGNPSGPPIEASDGNFYGTTSYGGKTGNIGTVYKITPSGVLTTLNSFGWTSSRPYGNYPNGPLMEGNDGFLYGTTFYGGSDDLGTIFRVSSVSGSITFMLSFDGTSGQNPLAGLTQGSDGSFYGTTMAGPGSVDMPSPGGIDFKITPGGVFLPFYTFVEGGGLIPAANPIGGLTQATDGYFYGTVTFGDLVYRMSSTGSFTPLCQFSITSPQNMLLQHTNGILYGTTAVGGSADRGTFFSLNVGLGPFVRFLPNAGVVGQTVEFLGQGFTGTTGVSFNGTPAAFTVVSDTYLTATVPADATTGFVTVTTPGGTLQSNRYFRVLPQILGFSPTSGPVGTKVVITGTGFTGATEVELACKYPMSFTVDSETQITAIVPADGTTGDIMVFTPGGHVESTANFTVTP